MSRRSKRQIVEEEEDDAPLPVVVKKRKSAAKIVESDNEDDDNEEDENEVKGNHILPDIPVQIHTINDKQYRPGSIVRVKLHNFVTYSDCEFYPGPHLNIVVGPNGTGKSSIVCAFALGFGGKTSILGRAKEISAFIKHGETSGYTEIEVCDNNGKGLVLRREIKRDNSSDWRINGKLVKKKQVDEVVKSLNIQVDNLCQFLPQDKVGNFAQLSPQELLRETEKAAGTESMLSLHDKLIDLKKAFKSLDTTVKEHQSVLNDLEKRQEEVKRDVVRFQEREKHLKRVANLEMKKPWIEFEEQRIICLEAKQRKQEAEEELKNYDAERRKPILDKMRDVNNEINKIDKQKILGTNQYKNLENERGNKGTQVEKLENEEESIYEELKNLKNRAEDRKKQATRLRKEIENHKKELQEFQDKEAIKIQIDEKNRLLRDLEKELNEASRHRMDQDYRFKEGKTQRDQIYSKLKGLDDLRKQRLEALRNIDRDAYETFIWLQSNSNKFEKKVYGPILIELNVPNPLHAKYLEHVVPKWLMTAFVTQSQRDNKMLHDEVAANLRITTIKSTNIEGSVHFERPCDIKELHAYGITHWIDDVFECPSLVKEALRRNAPLANMAAGNNETINHVSTLLKHPSLSIFLTPENAYSKTRSKYGRKEWTTRVDPLPKAPKMLSGADMTQKSALTKQLTMMEEELNDIMKKVKEYQNSEELITQQQSKLKTEKSELQGMFKRRDTIHGKIQSKEQELVHLEAEEDTSSEQAKLEKKLKASIERRIKTILEIKDLMIKMTELVLEQDIICIIRLSLLNELNILKLEDERFENELRLLKLKVDEVAAIFQREHLKTKHLREIAESKAKLTDEIKELFATLPVTIEDIEIAIQDARAKADLNYSTNPKIIEQYNKRQLEIKELSEKLNEEKTNLAEQQSEIETLKSKWLPPLQELVKKVNLSFGKYFQQIHCAGEVHLITDPDDDFEKFAIAIKVKFRDEDSMKTLSAHAQSGGEKSVSTMLYLISLQDVTPCPFRLVDEINQGMDPVNERMIFSVIAESACKPGLPQYFLITPKLLHNLNFTPQMTVLCVFNGPWQMPQDQWDINKFLSNTNM